MAGSAGLEDAARTQAARAHEDALSAAADAGVHALEVRPPHPLGLVVGVADVVADRPVLAADLAFTCHDAGGCITRPVGSQRRSAAGPDAADEIAGGDARDQVDALDAAAPGLHLGPPDDVVARPVGALHEH